jgi:uncharacterized protein YqeY
MKNGDTVSKSTLRMLIAALANERITKQKDLTPDEEVTVVKRLIKQREDSAALYEQGGAPLKAQEERGENQVLRRYLPTMLEGDNLRALVLSLIEEVGATEKKHQGLVMKRLKELHGAAFDGKLASQVCAETLK